MEVSTLRGDAHITYSNYRFYDGKLWTFPGSIEKAEDVGIGFYKVDGTYRRGSTRDNPVEAAKVVERIRYHLSAHPNLSLGVVTFSSAQEDAIVAEIDRQIPQYPELADLITSDRLHGFFVKNLENVQGDERDILIFSIGYGPDEDGKLTMNFGPVNLAGGWRRLNVAITRARRRVEVVSSITAGQIRDTGSEGVRHLKGYLDFAERGADALAMDIEESLGDVESPFEDEVFRRVRSMGYSVTPQVGVAGYRIDLAVRHPDEPGRFVLGIECDGAAYHSSKVARDRDRLREGVLRGLGWNIFRIWGLSWYRDRERQEARLRDAIEAAIAGGRPTPTGQSSSVVAAPDIEVEEFDFDEAPAWAVPYFAAKSPSTRTNLPMHDPAAAGELRRLISAVVQTEVAVHEDRVLKAVRLGWSAGRSSKRMREAFEQSVGQLSGTVSRDLNGFLRVIGTTQTTVRVPMDDGDTRTVFEVPPEEISLALLHILHDTHAISQDDLTTAAARVFGWGRRGSEIQSALDRAIDQLIDSGSITDDGMLLHLSDSVRF